MVGVWGGGLACVGALAPPQASEPGSLQVVLVLVVLTVLSRVLRHAEEARALQHCPALACLASALAGPHGSGPTHAWLAPASLPRLTPPPPPRPGIGIGIGQPGICRLTVAWPCCSSWTSRGGSTTSARGTARATTSPGAWCTGKRCTYVRVWRVRAHAQGGGGGLTCRRDARRIRCHLLFLVAHQCMSIAIAAALAGPGHPKPVLALLHAPRP